MENVSDRTRMLDLLLDIEDARRGGAPVMGGRVLVTAVVSTIPRAVWPGKERLMAVDTWQVEEVIERHFGLPVVDMASTVLTHGYADGGVAGVIVYMALFGLALGFCERYLGMARSALVGLAIYALGLSLAVQIEANVTDLFAVGRVIAVLVVVDRVAGHRIEQWTGAARARSGMARPAWAI